VASQKTSPSNQTLYEEVDETGEPPCVPLKSGDVLAWLPLPGNPEYAVVGHFLIRDQGPQLIGLQFDPWSKASWPPPMLTTAMYRRAPIDRLYELVRFCVAQSRPIFGFNFDVDLHEFARNRRPGRKGRPDIFYARLAAQYVDICRTSSTPTKDLALTRNFSSSSTRDLLNQARSRGLLTRPPKGLSGGELTKKAEDLLAAKEGV
jgi:hypothetical protein